MLAPALLTLFFAACSSAPSQPQASSEGPALERRGPSGDEDEDARLGYYNEVPLSDSFTDGKAKCGIFIKADGEYGPTGRTIAKYLRMENSPFAVLISDDSAQLPSIRQSCSYFTSMTKEDRIHVMVWIMASIAWDESKCGQNMVNKGNSQAVGLFQMDKKVKNRGWRGPYCEASSVAPDKGKADPHEANTLCALDILRGQFEGLYGDKGLYPHAYFEKLRGRYAGNFSKSEILRRVHQHPGCNPTRPKPRPLGWEQ